MEKIKKTFEAIRQDPLTRYIIGVGLIATLAIVMFAAGYITASLHYDSMLSDWNTNKKDFEELEKKYDSMLYQIKLLEINYEIFANQIYNVLELAAVQQIQRTEEMKESRERLSDQD